MSLGITEITLILVVILLLFGGKRIPELARALGRASYEFKKAKDVIKKETEELKGAIEDAQEKFIDLRKSNGILERVRLEEYIMGVLQFELPYTTPMETLKAQAVLARTYVYRQEELGQELSQNNGTQLYQDQTYLKTIYKDDYLDYFDHYFQNRYYYYRFVLADSDLDSAAY